MVRSQRVANISDYLAPTGKGWGQIAGADIRLMPTPLSMQPTEYIQKSWENRPYGGVKSLRVASVHDGETWAIRATWQGVSPAGKDFPDALAVALPVSGKPALITMGGDGAPVQFLRWAANKEKPMSIVATGIGSSRPGAKIKSSAQGEATGDTWNVVITRALGFGKEVAPLVAGKKTQIGFAVWLGANDERAGIKAFSIDWAELALDA